jgi:predicted TIM-barrel fold metal-dependent hydrolase
MYIDAHCHAWHTWPYQPPVPDAQQRGRIEQLLFEMDMHGIDRALVVCAEIDHNPDNNAYVAEQLQLYPDRLYQVADVDSMWTATYHLPGAAERLQTAAGRWPLTGFTHYLRADDPGDWLYTPEGLDFFGVAAAHRLLASIHCHPHQQAAVRRVAAQFPTLPILIHHLGHPKVGDPAGLDEILLSARHANIFIKVSGFYYATAQARWEYPLADVQPIVRAIYQHYGAQRLCWGSDYPVVGQFLTYRQALEKFRTHCAFIPPADQERILGANLLGIIEGT